MDKEESLGQGLHRGRTSGLRGAILLAVATVDALRRDRAAVGRSIDTYATLQERCLELTRPVS